MEICKLDVWAIQHNPNYAETTIASLLKTDEKRAGQNDTFIEGFTSKLTIGNKEVKTYFDSAYFSSKKNALILLMQGGKITPERFHTLLENNDISYYITIKSNIIHFNEPEHDNKELSFAKNKNSLFRALDDSLEDGINTCEYYHNAQGNLSLYFSSQIGLTYIPINGVIVLEDKIILILAQGLEDNLSFEEVLRLLNNKGFIISIKDDTTIPDEDYKRLVKGQ